MHIGLILDGNRRWAKKRGLPVGFGHKQGSENFENICQYAAKRGDIEVLSAFALSTENLARDPKELQGLFRIFLAFEKKVPQLQKDGIRVRFSGNLPLLPTDVRMCFQRIEAATNSGTNLILQLCVAHGGKDEIVRAVKKSNKNISDISESDIENHLDSAGLPPVDLVIRTGGTKRLSNFLLWEAAYAELYFTDILWPDFHANEFEAAIEFYYQQQRNFGK